MAESQLMTIAAIIAIQSDLEFIGEVELERAVSTIRCPTHLRSPKGSSKPLV